MSHDDKRADLDPVDQDIIRRKARKLMRRGGFSLSDLPDLEQDLSLHLLERMTHFDPCKADWSVYVTAVVTAWGANLLRARYAAKRDPRRLRSLTATTEEGQEECGRTGERISEQAHDARLGRHYPPVQEQLELKLDVQDALQLLPEDLRSIAEHLQHKTPAELARELKLPPTTLYGLIARIRRRFQRIGLGKNR